MVKFELNRNFTIIESKKTKWIPVSILLTQLGVSYLNNIIPLTLPSGFIERTYIEFILNTTGVVIWEEVIFRFIILGLLTVHFIDRYVVESKGLREVLRSTFNLTIRGIRYPYELSKENYDDYFTLGLIVSSIGFGLIHIPGFGEWKFIPTLFMGIVLGLLFLRYGLIISLGYHLLHNYILISAEYFVPELEFLVEYILLPFSLFLILLAIEYYLPIPERVES